MKNIRTMKAVSGENSFQRKASGSQACRLGKNQKALLIFAERWWPHRKICLHARLFAPEMAQKKFQTLFLNTGETARTEQE